ncbi:MAG: SusC/RagA family protein, partial [Bacteroidetes bacterium HGW-Bacteroidetes-22]
MKVSGKVSDASDGKTLPGVTVAVKGTTSGTITDIDGNYSIGVSKGATLAFTFIGYTPQEVVVAGQSTIDIILAPSITSLDEVVIIGYGAVKKKDATGSVSVVGSKDFNRGAITSAQELMVGKATGVVITSAGGAPGAGQTIRIRGGASLNASNDPLIVIDGVPIDNTEISGSSNILGMVNPNDVESFTVLKDASATAIYGSRASNGVILITTKKGSGQAGGKKFSVTYNGQLSMGTVPGTIDVMSGDEFRSTVNRLYEEGYTGINDVALGRLGTASTDWQDEVFRTAFSHDHNVNVAGSIDNLPYRVSIGYTDQNGVLKSTNLERTTGSINLNPSLFDDHLKVDANFKYAHSKQNFGNQSAVGSAVAYDPTQSVMNGNTRFGGYHTWTNLSDTALGVNGYPNAIGVSNPAALVNQTDNVGTVDRMIGNALLDYTFHWLPELKATLNIAFDHSSSDGHNNADTLAAWTYRSGKGSYIDYTQKKDMSLLDFYLNYAKDISEISSKFDATVGYSWQHFKRDGSTYNRNWDASKVVENSSYINENYLVSFFGRLNYTVLDRYLFTFTLRDDGSSRFSADNRWGLFPAAAFAWRIKDESFLKNVGVISDLKLRLGWGVTGQQDIIDNNYYPYIPVWQYSESSAYYQFGNQWVSTLRPNAYDENIKWEETTTYNAGLDFGFADDRFTGSLDFYLRKTKDMISTIPIPAGTNFSNYLTTNIGDMENKGVELALNYKPVVTKDILWTVGYNISYNKNEITKLTMQDSEDYTGLNVGDINGGVGNKIQNQNVGYARNSFYVFQQVYDANGMPIEGLYVDLTGDGDNVSGNDLNRYHY